MLQLPESTIELRQFNYNKWFTDQQLRAPMIGADYALFILLKDPDYKPFIWGFDFFYRSPKNDKPLLCLMVEEEREARRRFNELPFLVQQYRFKLH